MSCFVHPLEAKLAAAPTELPDLLFIDRRGGAIAARVCPSHPRNKRRGLADHAYVTRTDEGFEWHGPGGHHLRVVTGWGETDSRVTASVAVEYTAPSLDVFHWKQEFCSTINPHITPVHARNHMQAATMATVRRVINALTYP